MKLQIEILTNAPSQTERENDAKFLEGLASLLRGGVSLPAVQSPAPANAAGSEALLAAVAARAASTEDDDDGEAGDGTGFDSAGYPWDERIHSGGKTKIKKTGLWTPKRGVDPKLVEAVKAEFQMPSAAGVPAAPPAPAPAPAAAPVPATPTPAPAPVPAAPVAAVSTDPTAGLSSMEVFTQIIAHTNALTQSGKITIEGQINLLAKHGVSGLGMLAQPTHEAAARAILTEMLALYN